jgi:Protein of unknown function (DUF1761)
MAFGGMNYVAIIVAAIAGFALVTLWSRSAMKAGMSAAHFVTGAIAALVMSFVLAGLIGHLGVGQVTLRNGIVSALFVWTGFVATTLAVNHGRYGLGWRATLADGGQWLAALVMMGAIIGGFGAS